MRETGPTCGRLRDLVSRDGRPVESAENADVSRSSRAFPETWDRFGYALANPLRFVDPLGLSPYAPMAMDLSLYYLAGGSDSPLGFPVHAASVEVNGGGESGLTDAEYVAILLALLAMQEESVGHHSIGGNSFGMPYGCGQCAMGTSRYVAQILREERLSGELGYGEVEMWYYPLIGLTPVEDHVATVMFPLSNPYDTSHWLMVDSFTTFATPCLEHPGIESFDDWLHENGHFGKWYFEPFGNSVQWVHKKEGWFW